MPTKIYGVSDDLIEFEGDVTGEVGCYTSTKDEKPVLVICSDGTLLIVSYGKADLGIWAINKTQQGSLFLGITPCTSEDADPYSDVAHFRDGLKWAYAATEWGRVK
jgi:hypothetical protein